MSNLNLKVPQEFHKGLKAYSVLIGKSMNEIVINAVKKEIESTQYSDETISALEKAKANIGFVQVNSLKELYKELSIGN